ncbi:hypothetical protein [Piscirickettsia litoralis]|uniref:Uncharacterized protein n=1 Tax=Piscirickettsia litoralis TaxID=1891921 RepID=A0ABX3A4R8_9GAMM|nr:hypothetical protein [Piscirickettsia litoralis]ODN43856.1 hypothetical protein BGC07_14370 [Piscirickettsia litoralis]
MPKTALKESEKNRLDLAHSYFLRYGLVGPGSTAASYFGFNAAPRTSWNEHWFRTRYEMNDIHQTRDDYSRAIRQGLTFERVNVTRIDNYYLTQFVELIKKYEMDRADSFTSTSKDRLMILSKIMDELSGLGDAVKPVAKHVNLINLCNKLAKDEHNIFGTNSKFKNLMKNCAEMLFHELGKQTARDLKSSFFENAKNVVDTSVDLARNLAVFAAMPSEFMREIHKLNTCYQRSVHGNIEHITTDIKTVIDSTKSLIAILERQLEDAIAIRKTDSKTVKLDQTAHKQTFTPNQQAIINGLEGKIGSDGREVRNSSIRDELDKYIRGLKDAMTSLAQHDARIATIGALPACADGFSDETRVIAVQRAYDKEVSRFVPNTLPVDSYIRMDFRQNKIIHELGKEESPTLLRDRHADRDGRGSPGVEPSTNPFD